ncbi:16S rRNA (guanine(527)-N(7))-methyltransferase RsmG [Thermodesulfobacteriota bacterium]
MIKIDSDKWKRFIRNGAEELDISIEPGQIDLFVVHAVELVKWNRKINLTAIADPLEIAVKHFLDSIAPAGLIPPDGTMLDVGSGGGFPGIPLKILFPSLTVTLIDASRKKINFLKHLIRTLKLEGIQALHVRAEDLADVNSKIPFGQDRVFENEFDVVICRALTSLDGFALMAFPLLNRGGFIIALKGKVGRAEMESVRFRLEKTPGVTGGEERQLSIDVKKYTLPYLGSERSIVVIK